MVASVMSAEGVERVCTRSLFRDEEVHCADSGSLATLASFLVTPCDKRAPGCGSSATDVKDEDAGLWVRPLSDKRGRPMGIVSGDMLSLFFNSHACASVVGDSGGLSSSTNLSCSVLPTAFSASGTALWRVFPWDLATNGKQIAYAATVRIDRESYQDMMPRAAKTYASQ